MKIIFLNGPPRSGKDTSAECLQVYYTGIAVMKFSDPAKSGTHAAFGLVHGINHFESRKDQPCEEFFGFTPRECYINHSEKYMKPLYGEEIFGQLFVRRTEYPKYYNKQIIVIPDSGFECESRPVIKKFGAENCMLVRLHRPGCDYSKDSRSYLDLDIHTVVDIQNDGSMEKLSMEITDTYKSFMNSHV